MVPELRDFEGRWQIARRIEDRLGPDGVFAGAAVFAPVPEGLAYRETGLLRLGGGAGFHAERSYLWREAGGRIVVAFADGRSFHDFDPADPVAHHRCAADGYAVRYDFSAWPLWRADWTVQGPRKDYAMRSTYRRA